MTAVRFGLPIIAPFWRTDLRLTLAQVGLLFGAFDLGAMLFFTPIGAATDRWGEPAVLAGGALFTAAVFATTVWTGGLWPLAAVLAIAGIGYGSGQTAGNRAVAQSFPAR